MKRATVELWDEQRGSRLLPPSFARIVAWQHDDDDPSSDWRGYIDVAVTEEQSETLVPFERSTVLVRCRTRDSEWLGHVGYIYPRRGASTVPIHFGEHIGAIPGWLKT